jgi:hypothetical protein
MFGAGHHGQMRSGLMKSREIWMRRFPGSFAGLIAKGGAMEYLVAKYAGNDCGVIIDDVTGDWMTNEVSWVSAGHHVVRLSMPAGSFTPAQIAVELSGTSPQHPKTIQFFRA